MAGGGSQAAVNLLTNVAKAAASLGLGATLLSSSLYTVDGGQRAVLFDRSLISLLSSCVVSNESLVIAVLVIAMTIFSTGIDSKCFQFYKTEAEPDDVPYGYGFFHFVFAMGAMYFAMLLVGWRDHNVMQKWTIDVGWVSMWVRVVNEWLAAIIYIWMLVAPLVWKRRRAEFV